MGAGSSSSPINHAMSKKITILKQYHHHSRSNSHDKHDSFDKIFQADNGYLLDLLACCVNHHLLSQHIEIGRGNIFRILESDIPSIHVHDDHLKSNNYQRLIPSSDNVVIYADGLDIRSLDFIDTIALASKKIFGLNASNNKLSDNVIISLCNESLSSLRHLSLSRNEIMNVMNVCICSAATLQVLDLSYNRISFQPRCFMFCPYIKVLLLDSCNISTTISSSSPVDDAASSIFFGLAILEELSLCDNQLEDHDAFLGLAYFGRSLGKSYNGNAYNPCLRAISLSGNPYDRSARYAHHIMQYVMESISSLQIIDKKPCHLIHDMIAKDRGKYLSRSADVSTSCMSDLSSNHNLLDPLEWEYRDKLSSNR